MVNKRVYFFVALLIVALYGCQPDPVYPVEPVLTFSRFEQPNSGNNHDTLRVIFNFTDGDGDIGVPENSTDSNFVLTPYERNPATGTWQPINPNFPTPDSVPYTYRIPHLTAGQSGLEGEIQVTLNRAILRTAQDTVKFKAFLLDNNHHRSAFVLTDSVYLLP
jgi:hypothetical protein